MSRLTVDDKHYLFNSDNLGQPVHMGLPEKQKTFSQFFFLQYLLNTSKVGSLEKVFFSNRQNPKTVC